MDLQTMVRNLFRELNDVYQHSDRVSSELALSLTASSDIGDCSHSLSLRSYYIEIWNLYRLNWNGSSALTKSRFMISFMVGGHCHGKWKNFHGHGGGSPPVTEKPMRCSIGGGVHWKFTLGKSSLCLTWQLINLQTSRDPKYCIPRWRNQSWRTPLAPSPNAHLIKIIQDIKGKI